MIHAHDTQDHNPRGNQPLLLRQSVRKSLDFCLNLLTAIKTTTAGAFTALVLLRPEINAEIHSPEIQIMRHYRSDCSVGLHRLYSRNTGGHHLCFALRRDFSNAGALSAASFLRRCHSP
ncbi:hypothetical protein U1Q18_004472 [Sarracenia purpurea var. burkii]